MKILILTNYANGLYLFRRELVAAFQQKGYKVVVSVPPDENVVKLEKLGMTIEETDFNRHGTNPAKDLGLLIKYIKLIKRIKPAFVLTYTIKPNLYGGMAARFTGTPYICNVTGLGMAIQNGGLLSKILIAMYGFATGKAAKVFFQNENNMTFMQSHKVAVKNAGLLPGSGVNLTEHPLRDYPDESDGIRILSVIRVMKDKGITEYLDAAEAITAKYENVKFDLLGEYEEDERQEYEPRIKELEKKGVIRYLGHLDSAEPSMAASNIIVHPSYHEGLSNVLLEAAACGRPVLCSDVHGCIEAMNPDVSGFTFEAKSSSALTEAIERILALSPDERKQMGLAGRKFVEENFDRQLVIDAYFKVM